MQSKFWKRCLRFHFRFQLKKREAVTLWNAPVLPVKQIFVGDACKFFHNPMRVTTVLRIYPKWEQKLVNSDLLVTHLILRTFWTWTDLTITMEDSYCIAQVKKWRLLWVKLNLIIFFSQIKEKVEDCCNTMESNCFPTADISSFKMAYHELLECRRVLAFCNSFSYYLKDEPTREILENNVEVCTSYKI